MTEGIYEALVTKLVHQHIAALDKQTFDYRATPLDKHEAALILSKHISAAVQYALRQVKGENALETQIEIANKIIRLLRDELEQSELEEDLVDTEGKVLKAVFSKINQDYADLDVHLAEITPKTRLAQSSLFTGGKSDLSLESELQKEILSSDRVDFLVSFIRLKAINNIRNTIERFVHRGGQLRIITTTYIGATELKAIAYLSSLPNVEIKISYNTQNERLHAKAYMFYRNTGFHTAYVGSSNMSHSAWNTGLEWNVKLTTKEVPHVLDKFQKTFESYWSMSEFETYRPGIDTEKLKQALNDGQFRGKGISSEEALKKFQFFDLKPYHYQREILERLEVERSTHGRFRNLVVAATGTGKTVISAFDFKAFLKTNPQARLLFVAHREEILLQAMGTFRGVLKDNNFGEYMGGGEEPTKFNAVFASVATLKNRMDQLPLSPDYYDYIVIDEVHHVAASSYRPILKKFNPKVLLGLTATPERMDGANILEDFDGRIAAEIRLPEALNLGLLAPFQYFGITDSVDLSKLRWERGYVASELSKEFTSNDGRVRDILNSIEKYINDPGGIRALGFCVTIDHAQYMAEKFLLSGLKAAYLTSTNTTEREALRRQLKAGEINYLFVVDIFNEGVDIPEIDTVLFLRPTESLTVFLQQLGRGLRLAEGKDSLTVLDFVGNARPEYDFEGKFRALIGKTKSPVSKELEEGCPHLPLGCSIVLEKRAKEIILENIKKATNHNRRQLIQKIQNFKHESSLPLSLSNFTYHYHISLPYIYKRDCWSRLCEEAGVYESFAGHHEKAIGAALKKKWMATESYTYFAFVLSLARNGFTVSSPLTLAEEKMLLMLYYDVWSQAGMHGSLAEAIQEIGKDETLVKEIIEYLELKLNNISFKELSMDLPYAMPLKVHARYNREQILAAFGLSTYAKQSSNREGVADNKALKTEVMFVDLVKSEEDFSPTTMYDDYAISETLFHWQSQNQTRDDRGKGLSYIHHQKQGKRMMLFVREKAKDEFGNTMGYVFIGEVDYVSHTGSKPMSITWSLRTPMPNYLWGEAAKLLVG